jgi:hypothetical protein
MAVSTRSSDWRATHVTNIEFIILGSNLIIQLVILISAIATSPSVWAGVVVIPSSVAYEPPKEAEIDPAAGVEDQELSAEADADQEMQSQSQGETMMS